MKKELPKAYEPSKYEDGIYKKWEESGLFNPDNLDIEKNAKSYTISMPPPNRTGTLHMGHAVMLAIEDILTRYHRMKGERALWVPGTDHAAIATQTKVEKIIKEEGTNRHELGREKFLERVVEFAQESHDTIIKQIKKMGSSCDWSREAYTLDEIRTKAVRSVFKMMYDDGLIYRGERIVNWCPRCHSTLADDEVEYREEKGKFYWIKYGPFVLATARPETKLGDTAVAVHPDDKRYEKMVGKKYMIPGVLGEFEIIVIADKSVDPEFGTGAVKVTPAHSFIDNEMAQRHGIAMKKIINEDGRMMDNCGKYAGMTTKEARVAIVADMEKMGLIDHIEDNYDHNIAVCYRCDTQIEPIPSLQWFIDVNKKIPKHGKTIKELSVEAVKTGVFEKDKIKIVPERFEKNYFHWMENLRDWCISRQIWFGHRVPVWHKTEVGSSMEAVHFKESVFYKKLGLKNEKEFDRFSDNLLKESSWKDKNIQWSSQRDGIIQVYIGYVDLLKKKGLINDSWIEQNRINKPQRDAQIHIGENPPEEIGWYQDPDTLDTWFSSGLWTFSTLASSSDQISIKDGKLEINSEDFKNFHPTQVLETGYDILFFWIARMIIMTTYTLGEIPFEDVYLHGLIRDEKGKKMSKSLGNVIDPLDMIKKYGTDATRLSLVIGTTPGNDMNLSEAKVAGFRNFANKLWNISRYIISNYELRITNYELNQDKLTSVDKWILSKMRNLNNEVTDDIDNYRFSQAGERLREFTWSDLADWYLEASKFEKNNEKEKILLIILKDLLKLWHPFMPFVTEQIWEMMGEEKMLIIVAWPTFAEATEGKPSANGDSFEIIKDIITAIRNARAMNKVEPSRKVKAVIYADKYVNLIKENEILIKSLKTGIEELEVKEKGEDIPGAIFTTVNGIEVYLLGAVDKEKEKERIEKEIENLNNLIKNTENKLANEEFISKAPAPIVEKEKERLAGFKEEVKKLEEQLNNLN